ncbi:2-deoxy-D-gluconate 3-dehydrogenase [Isoptericola sp. CG 20/1183]|uniref:2-deoxy-D-gluconate 3-dehydrogenase n=1 Tax=Isoptericola halotolerans TaxID=300560 RepID=A0ABX5EHU6_9MICO|nr:MULTISPECIES: 2-dehydro-3-deoxy-D-gluconate 5-dehydrogenase KduD [Isoptericola]PRZ08678.1 2-deoxy-D-gluconate 3-dehydrogenase [Isoptericola halotolerans]PRZ10875.1 2-deoxy-D-gluconate 3-dehydrogenase [Isoptericola sp. CG 20/1183]
MILDQFRLDGKVALVTGTSRGLGQGAAVALAEAGADVALLDRSEPTETIARIEALGRRAFSVRRDLATATPAELDAAVAEVVAELGEVDVLVNNAGTIRRAPAAEHPAEDWDTVLAVNLDAVFHLSRAVGRGMLERGAGSIINVASMLSFQGGILVPGYAASKHAVVGLTKALANEWAGRGVNVNAVAPGYMATDNTAPIRADEAREQSISARIPAGRWGTPEDLAGIFVYLASPASAYVHGAVVPVDGGWLVR